MKRDVNDLLLGASAGAGVPWTNYLQSLADAATRIAVALEAGSGDANVGARIVSALEANAKALESIAKDVAVLRSIAEREGR